MYFNDKLFYDDIYNDDDIIYYNTKYFLFPYKKSVYIIEIYSEKKKYFVCVGKHIN